MDVCTVDADKLSTRNDKKKLLDKKRTFILFFRNSKKKWHNNKIPIHPDRCYEFPDDNMQMRQFFAVFLGKKWNNFIIYANLKICIPQIR